MHTFGTALREARERKQLSQGALGQLLGVSQQTVAQWEANRAQPRKERRLQLLAILGPHAHLGDQSAPMALPQPKPKMQQPDLYQYLPPDLHQHIDVPARMGGSTCRFTYASPRQIVEVRLPDPARGWEQFAVDILRLAIARQLGEAAGNSRESFLIVVHDGPALRDMQAAMFGAGVLGVGIVALPSVAEAAELIESAER